MTMTVEPPTSAADSAPVEAVHELDQTERELAEVARSIADLYARPANGGDEYRLREQTREGLEVRLDALRARALALQLACGARAHAETEAALGESRVELRAAEGALHEAHRRVTVARERVEELTARERLLRDQREGLRRRLAVSAAPPVAER